MRSLDGQEEIDVKYMLMTFGDRSGLEGRSPEWITGMIEFMRSIDVELRDSGELVFQQGLANAPEAKTVRLNGGSPKVTDGPVALPASEPPVSSRSPHHSC